MPADRLLRIAACVMLLAAVAMSLGCPQRIGGSGETLDRVADRLRQENEQLKQEARELDQRAKRLEQRLAAIERSGRPEVIEGAEPPRLGSVRFIERFTQAIDTDDDGSDDMLSLRVQTLDIDGRFLLVTGRAQVQAVQIRPGEDPRVLAQSEVGPEDWDRAYRKGFFGTYHALELPLPDPLPEGAHSAVVKLRFTEARDGLSFETQHTVTIQR